MFNTTFINQNNENTIVEEGLKHLQSTQKDSNLFLNTDNITLDEILSDCEDSALIEQIEKECEENEYKPEDIPVSESEHREEILDYYQTKFYEYGLSFGYVEIDSFEDQEEDYFRYQISWGGPSEEVRFYKDGTIIFVYLDWFSGVGFDVSNEEAFESLRQYFEDVEMLDFEQKREETDYYTKMIEREAADEE